MARARNIKPAFFTNDHLADVHPLGRLLFIGLWTVADREGRLEDRPRRIKAEVLPYDDVDCDTLLNQLAEHGFILRYSVDSKRFIQVLKFNKHQNPHMKEAASVIPAPDLTGTSTVQAPNLTGSSPAESLNPLTDTGYLNEDTGYLNADSGGTANADAQAQAPATPPAKPKPKTKRATQVPETWMPSDKTREWANAEGFTADQVNGQILRFVDHWRGKGETRKDWDATFRNWMRNAREWGHLSQSPPGTDTAEALTTAQRLDRKSVV